jgi:hypothetical protein
VSQEILEPKSKRASKTPYQPSNRDAKRSKKNAIKEEESSSSSDYDSEEEDDDAKAAKDNNMVTIQVKTPAWADQVVDFVLGTLGWSNPEASQSTESSQMTGVSSDFKSQHLIALFPTLWTLLN